MQGLSKSKTYNDKGQDGTVRTHQLAFSDIYNSVLIVSLIVERIRS